MILVTKCNPSFYCSSITDVTQQQTRHVKEETSLNLHADIKVDGWVKHCPLAGGGAVQRL